MTHMHKTRDIHKGCVRTGYSSEMHDHKSRGFIEAFETSLLETNLFAVKDAASESVFSKDQPGITSDYDIMELRGLPVSLCLRG